MQCVGARILNQFFHHPSVILPPNQVKTLLEIILQLLARHSVSIMYSFITPTNFELLINFVAGPIRFSDGFIGGQAVESGSSCNCRNEC